MAGVYVHIPFCKTRCSYCDFHSGTNILLKKTLVEALCNEIEERKEYLKSEPVKTIYFGGGTPSILNSEELQRVLNTINNNFDTTKCEEITIEANPDDLNNDYVKTLRKIGFNRISIGIQSFNDKELKLINRRHTALKAIEAVRICQENGFSNISIDLMYGLPSQNLQTWQENLNQAILLNIQHISAYHLTYEKGTLISKLANQNKISPVSEETSIEMFKMLINTIEKEGFEQYEISNFAKNGFKSKHNSSYWNEIKYMGIGPSAHSYDGNSRQWNINNTEQYIINLQKKTSFFEKEVLSLEEKYNDYIITRLRTKEGINIVDLKNKFGEKLSLFCLKNTENWLKRKQLSLNNNQLQLTKEGLFISDSIFSDLIWVKD